MRSEWSETWLDVAHAVAKRSACFRRQAGTVIVDENNRILATGYNGAPPGLSPYPKLEYTGDCRDWCPRSNTAVIAEPKSYDDCVAMHSETNALAYADPIRTIGGVAYTVPGCPCFGCAKSLAAAQLSAVVFHITEHDRGRDPERSVELLARCGVKPIIVSALEEFRLPLKRLDVEVLSWV